MHKTGIPRFLARSAVVQQKEGSYINHFVSSCKSLTTHEQKQTSSAPFENPKTMWKYSGSNLLQSSNFSISKLILKLVLLLRTAGWRLKSAHYIHGWNTICYIILGLAVANCLNLAKANRFTDKSSNAERSRFRSDSHRRQDKSRCEILEVPMCIDIGYNLTDVTLSPANIFKQSDASTFIVQFAPLLRTNCSEEMKLLVCSVYTPICMSSYPKFLPPCRFICKRAKRGCGPLFEKYGVEWPKLFNCDNFPDFAGGNQLCLHFNRTRNWLDEENLNVLPSIPYTNPVHQKPINGTPIGIKPSISGIPHETGKGCPCTCIPPMVKLTDPNDPLYNHVSTGGMRDCVMPCKSPYFTDDRRKSAESWITVWSVVCFTATLLTVSTFLTDTHRFAYPERPIIFLSACYMFVSVGFLLRIGAGHEAVACVPRSDRVLYDTTGPFLCSLVFLLVYFFGMAGVLWWVILSLTWFLAAGLKWESDAIARYSQYYHAAAWLIPVLKSITILATSKVDGDSLSGICYVGNQSTSNLRDFVIVPLLAYLILGGVFLLLGFLNLFPMRVTVHKPSEMQAFLQVNKKMDTFERLKGRIGLFSLLHMIPFAALLACYFYELQNREQWARAYNCRIPISGSKCIYSMASRPEFAAFIVKYSMTLVIGITNMVWICTSKTIISWRKFYNRGFVSVCGPTGLIFWLERRNMKNNSTVVSTLSEESTQKSDVDCSNSRDKIEGATDPGEETNSVKTSSRDDINVTHNPYLDCDKNSQSYHIEFLHKSLLNSLNGSGCKRYSCDCSVQAPSLTNIELNHNVNIVDSVSADSTHDSFLRCCIEIPQGGRVRSACSKKPCPIDCERHQKGLVFPRSLSLTPRPVVTELEAQSCCVHCHQCFKNSYRLAAKRADNERVRHIYHHHHHHHHHHLSNEGSCKCFVKGRRRASSLTNKYSSQDIRAVKFTLDQDQRTLLTNTSDC